MTINALDHHHDHHVQTEEKVTFGFWVYVMTDFIMFATLFATYAVLHNNTYGGPGILKMAGLHHVLVLTLILSVSAFTCGLAMVAKAKESLSGAQFWLVVTFLLGIVFLGMQYHQLAFLVHNGITWQGSAFLSVYFTLIGIFGLHLAIALLWIVILLIQFVSQGLTNTMKTRLTCLSLFWYFLNLVWILIFTIVYLSGAI